MLSEIDGFQKASSSYVGVSILCADNVLVAFLSLLPYGDQRVPFACDVVLHPDLLVGVQFRVIRCMCVLIAFGFSRHCVSACHGALLRFGLFSC